MKYTKQCRLLKPEQFRYVFEKPKKIRGEAVDFYIRRNTNQGPRLGLAVPKRAVKSAVLRNRIKRLVREAFRQNPTALGGFDIIVMVKPKMLAYPTSEFGDIIKHHWQGLIKQCEASASN